MIVLIDNYDSFTYNLVHYVQELGADVAVYRNDALTAAAVLQLRPTGIILSPGPCTPNEAGICLELVQKAGQKSVPLLGVCLGHQAIGQAFGGSVIRAPQPMHGKVSVIHHHGHPLFSHIPESWPVTRYHSLIVERATLPACLLPVAALPEDGMIMALAHADKPVYGVQFHPESIASHYGYQLLSNFLALAKGQAPEQRKEFPHDPAGQSAA